MPLRSTLEGAVHEFTHVREARGEICLVVEGAGAAAAARASDDAEQVARVLRELLASGTPVSSAVKEVGAGGLLQGARPMQAGIPSIRG